MCLSRHVVPTTVPTDALDTHADQGRCGLHVHYAGVSAGRQACGSGCVKSVCHALKPCHALYHALYHGSAVQWTHFSPPCEGACFEAPGLSASGSRCPTVVRALRPSGGRAAGPVTLAGGVVGDPAQDSFVSATCYFVNHKHVLRPEGLTSWQLATSVRTVSIRVRHRGQGTARTEKATEPAAGRTGRTNGRSAADLGETSEGPPRNGQRDQAGKRPKRGPARADATGNRQMLTPSLRVQGRREAGSPPGCA